MASLFGIGLDHAKEEEEEFCELLYVLANSDLSFSTQSRYRCTASRPSWTRPTIQVIPCDSVDSELEMGKDGAVRKGVCPSGRSASQESANSPPCTPDARAGNASSWVENLHYALQLNELGWKSHALFATADLTTTVVTAVLLPIMKPAIVHLMTGGRWAIILNFTPCSLIYFIGLYRMFYICNGVWPRRSVLIVLMLLCIVLRLLGFVLLPVFDVLQAVAFLLPPLYLTSDLFLGVDRSLLARVLLHFGVWLSAAPLFIGPIIHILMTHMSNTSHIFALGAYQLRMQTGTAMLLWTGISMVVHKAGLLTFRYSIRKGARTVKQFEFLVLYEVGFTATGLQLFSASAFIPYAAWAVVIHLCQICWMTPQFRQCYSAGSTQALHVVRLFVETITKSFGILIGLLVAVICTSFQRILHPECDGMGASMQVGFKAPVIPHGDEIPCLVCFVLVVASMALSVLGAVYFIQQLQEQIVLNSLWVPSRPKDCHVNTMIKTHPVTLLMGIARVCLLRSRVELRLLTTLYILLMSDSYFVLSWMMNQDFWLDWHRSHSWFHCSHERSLVW